MTFRFRKIKQIKIPKLLELDFKNNRLTYVQLITGVHFSDKIREKNFCYTIL